MRRLTAILVAALAAVVLTTPASASTDQEAMFQDDALLVYPPRAEVARTLDTLQGLGVDRIRVSVYWRLVAPSADSESRPSFSGGGASDPNAYPNGSWKRYDDLVRLAYERGIGVNFNVAGPAPDWASSGRGGYANPSARDFGAFVAAVGTRYSGSFTPPGDQQSAAPPPPPKPYEFPYELPGPPPTPPPPPSDTRPPRVNYWSFWNEPNQRMFMMPQYVNRHEVSPRIYRALVDAAWSALARTGHGSDFVIVGDTAPKGAGARAAGSNMRPLRFVRALYCVSARLRPLTGAGARALGCPGRNQVRRFPASHPALFRAAGYAHHPYSLLTPPARRSRNGDDVGLADVGRLSRTLRRIFSAYRVPRDGLQIFNTQFGYRSRPPGPSGVSQRLQAAYINQAEFMSYVNPLVRSFDQFLLEDAPSSQTGLLERSGRVKPAFAAFRIPIFIPAARRRSPGRFRVWGAARPARNGSRQTVQVQYRPRGRGAKWRTVKNVTTRRIRSYVDTRVRLSRTGSVRLRWARRGAGTLYSRAVTVRIGR